MQVKSESEEEHVARWGTLLKILIREWKCADLHLFFLFKVELTHPDNATEGQITLACIRLNQTCTGLSNLHMIDSPHGVFDPELEQNKFVEGSQKLKKNYVSMRESMHWICSKIKG